MSNYIFNSIVSAVVIFFALGIIFTFWTESHSERFLWQRLCRKFYIYCVGYSEKEFYNKFSCQRVLFRAGHDAPNPERDKFISKVLDPKVSSSQRMTLLEEVFKDSEPCKMGGLHEGLAVDRSEQIIISKKLVNKRLGSLTPENGTLLLTWLTHTYPKMLNIDDTNAGVIRSPCLRLLLDRRLPRKAVFDSFLVLLKNLNDDLSPWDVTFGQSNASIAEKSVIRNTEFLRAFILSPRRTQEEISLLAYKPYPWLEFILFESPLIREEERVAFALANNGAK